MAKVNKVNKMIGEVKTHYIMQLGMDHMYTQHYLVRITGSSKDRKGNATYDYEVLNLNRWPCERFWEKMDQDVGKEYWPKKIRGMDVCFYDPKTKEGYFWYDLRELNMKDDPELIIDHEITYALFQ